MSWNDFKNYLEGKILEEADENDSNQYILNPTIKTKYNIREEKEILNVLDNLTDSIVHHGYNEDYYALPQIKDLYNEDFEVITWQEIFPDRRKIFFGQKGELNKVMSEETYNILAQIWYDWVFEYTREDRLREMAKDENVFGKILVEGMARLNAVSLKKQGYDKKLRDWLAEYNQLEENTQKNLDKEKKAVTFILKVLEEDNDTNQSWFSNINSKAVIKWGGAGLLVIVVLLLIRWLRNRVE